MQRFGPPPSGMAAACREGSVVVLVLGSCGEDGALRRAGAAAVTLRVCLGLFLAVAPFNLQPAERSWICGALRDPDRK